MSVELWLVLVLFGLAFFYIGATGKGVEGFNLKFGDVASAVARWILSAAGVTLLSIGALIALRAEPRSTNSREPDSIATTTPSMQTPKTTTDNTETRSPEATISAYFAALEQRDRNALRELKPSENLDEILRWLEGRGTHSPIRLVKLIRAERTREVPLDSPTEVTIQGRVRHCRVNGRGTEENKDYILSRSNGVWTIEAELGPKGEVDDIRC